MESTYTIADKTYNVTSTEGQDFTGKILLIRAAHLAPIYQNGDRRFHATGGFGCSPTSIGRAVFGTFLVDGEHARMDRANFEGVLTDI